MQADYLIIGSGIAGTLLSYELILKGKSVIVIDDNSTQNASTVAGAVLNPVNIKQWNLAIDYGQYISQALHTYESLQALLNIPVISEIPVIVFNDDAGKKNDAVATYIHPLSAEETKLTTTCFSSNSFLKKITPSWQIHSITLLSAWKKHLLSKSSFISGHFDAREVNFSKHSVVYKNISAEKIIFCEGASGINNLFFTDAPFTRNRGEALLLSIPELPQHNIYHSSIRLVPTNDQLFWCGSNYIWNYTNLDAGLEWQKQTVIKLKQWLKLPFTIEKHIVAERPTTAGQKPLMLVHDQLPAAMFNGLGTRGFLIAPLLAKQFAEKLTDI